MLHDLFSVPVWVDKVDPNTYNKDQILEDVYYNYNIDPLRDNFSHHAYVPCSMHHLFRDRDNNRFRMLNYKILKVVYQNAINKFVSACWDANALSAGGYHCNLDIVNYTAMSKNNHMGVHHHSSFQFVGVHYVQFDKENHTGMRIWNPNNQYIFTEGMFDSYNYFIHHANHKKTYVPNIEEDTLVIIPGYLEHDIPPLPDIDSDKLRISIAFNFNLERPKLELTR